ncbi:MAG: hypothetical protein KHZ95_05245 [Eubacterium sp.]|nr:hypothetical protein [Eubacterium sp.]
MNTFDLFLKENRKERQCYYTEVCKDIKDEKGNIVKWKFTPLTTREEEEIREEATETVNGNLKLNMTKYIEKLITASVIYPNLYDATLQDSYNCKTPESLLKAIVNIPGEYSDLARLVQEKNGFNSLREDIEKAKN